MLWLRGRRPREPRRWRALVGPFEERVAAWARGKLKLADGEVIFEDRWGQHKVTFSRRQHMKCGYCEVLVGPDPNGGDMDHHRPKAEISVLDDDPANWGEEISGHNSRAPGKPRRVRAVCRGYFWLAYRVDNYVFTCGTCNQKWKGSLFPIEGGHRGAPTPQSCARERPLLLDPYGDVDPAQHLEFNEIGLVVPRNESKIGLETIRTYHLARASLQASRGPVAEVAWMRIRAVLKELGRTPRDDRRLRDALRRLLNWGGSRRAHAGMVRALWVQRDPYGFSWQQLRDLRASLSRS